MIVILAVALIVVGPDKLPELARSLAKGVNELKNTMNQVKESLNEETKVVSSVQRDLQQTAGQVKTHLLEDATKNPHQWKQEGDAVASGNAGEDEGIDVESLPPRSWEEEPESLLQQESASDQPEVAENGVDNKAEHPEEVDGDEGASTPRPSSLT